jgi:predicted porin
MNENETSRNADLLWAWQYGVEYSLSKNPTVIFEFDHQVQEDTELQDAFAVGANALPFSEVKKG